MKSIVDTALKKQLKTVKKDVQVLKHKMDKHETRIEGGERRMDQLEAKPPE